MANRDVLHKIGVTGGRVETRIANASLDPTFLMAEVEVIASYQLYNINRLKLENVIHRVFDAAQLDIEVKDRFGNPVRPVRVVSGSVVRGERSGRADQRPNHNAVCLRPQDGAPYESTFLNRDS